MDDSSWLPGPREEGGFQLFPSQFGAQPSLGTQEGAPSDHRMHFAVKIQDGEIDKGHERPARRVSPAKSQEGRHREDPSMVDGREANPDLHGDGALCMQCGHIADYGQAKPSWITWIQFHPVKLH